MAGGWAHDGAVQEQIDASIEDAIEQARSNHCDWRECPVLRGMRCRYPGRTPRGNPGGSTLRYMSVGA